jgi:hypothetical protein
MGSDGTRSKDAALAKRMFDDGARGNSQPVGYAATPRLDQQREAREKRLHNRYQRITLAGNCPSGTKGFAPMTHTPSPWTIHEYGDDDLPNLVIHQDSERRICFMATPGSQGDPAIIEANANLICAAPDLYDALRFLTEMAGYAIGNLDPEWARKNSGDLMRAIEDAETAMSKLKPSMSPRYVAKFAEDGAVTLEPDTAETRADFNETMRKIFAGEFEGVTPVLKDDQA